MALDDFAPVRSLRNSRHRTAIGIITLILGVIFLLLGLTLLVYPEDYYERIALMEDDWASYPVSIYGPMYEGDEVKIEFEVVGDNNADMFIVDDNNVMLLLDEQPYETLFEIDRPVNSNEVVYVLAKDGPINVVFYNPNSEVITLDIAVTDMTYFPWMIFLLFSGILLATIGGIALTGRLDNVEPDPFSNSEQYLNLPPTPSPTDDIFPVGSSMPFNTQQQQKDIICELCQRRFDSQEHLGNHIMNSDLHKKNLEAQTMQKWKQG